MCTYWVHPHSCNCSKMSWIRRKSWFQITQIFYLLWEFLKFQEIEIKIENRRTQFNGQLRFFIEIIPHLSTLKTLFVDLSLLHRYYIILQYITQIAHLCNLPFGTAEIYKCYINEITTMTNGNSFLLQCVLWPKCYNLT